MGVIANNHIYEIGEDLRKKMSNIIRGQNVQFMGDLIEDHKKAEKEANLIKYYETAPNIDRSQIQDNFETIIQAANIKLRLISIVRRYKIISKQLYKLRTKQHILFIVWTKRI
jgi:hypothetical protein